MNILHPKLGLLAVWQLHISITISPSPWSARKPGWHSWPLPGERIHQEAVIMRPYVAHPRRTALDAPMPGAMRWACSPTLSLLAPQQAVRSGSAQAWKPEKVRFLFIARSDKANEASSSALCGWSTWNKDRYTWKSGKRTAWDKYSTQSRQTRRLTAHCKHLGLFLACFTAQVCSLASECLDQEKTKRSHGSSDAQREEFCTGTEVSQTRTDFHRTALGMVYAVQWWWNTA